MMRSVVILSDVRLRRIQSKDLPIVNAPLPPPNSRLLSLSERKALFYSLFPGVLNRPS
jgi:hypothetical protein